MSTKLATPERQPAQAGRPAWFARFVRPKGHLSPRAVWLLAIAAGAPLLTALARILALPGIEVAGFTAFGDLLNSAFSLQWVPPTDRWTILYILLLPTATVLIALARLTFGLRVLGFRSILIAVGIHEIGLLPSLILILLVVTTIMLVRPPMRRIQLPFYARVGAILCIASMLLVGGLVLGPALHSDTLWSFAFFPVIILAMLAEGIGATLARDDGWTAAWRAGWTIVLALLIAFVTWIPAVREVALQFPELILTQLVAIVFISEFLDLRLLEQWPARLKRRIQQQCDSQQRSGPSKVAVVQNRRHTDVIGRLGVGASRRERTQSVRVVVDALREQGFTVEVFEADMSLLGKLHGFLPPDPLSGAPGGLVLNLAAGVQGLGRPCHLPAMLEMAGVAYTGPDPIVQSRLLDRYALMMLLRQSGVRTPPLTLTSNASHALGDLRFPLIVRPRYEVEEGRVVVKDRQALEAAVRRIVRNYRQEALIEAWEKAPEIRVCLLGNGTIECLPLLEIDAAGNHRICPARLDIALANRIGDCARAAYVAAGCRDYARIDIRLTEHGEPQVVGVYAIGLFARNGSFAQAAQQAGCSFAELMRRIVEIAWKRYRPAPALQLAADRAEHPAIPLLDRKAAAK